MDTPLPMTDREWQDRLARSRQALGSWTWEASLPWADRNLMRTIAETEIAALRHYVPYNDDPLGAAIGEEQPCRASGGPGRLGVVLWHGSGPVHVAPSPAP
jgi:hypothetical protein